MSEKEFFKKVHLKAKKFRQKKLLEKSQDSFSKHTLYKWGEIYGEEAF